MKNNDAKKEQILEAALKVAVKKGTSDITIREVAKEAKVNVAAINYYFSTKRQMLVAMEAQFLENFNDAFSSLSRTDIGDEEKLKEWLTAAMQYAVRYPGIFILLRDKFVSNAMVPANQEMKTRLISYIGEVRRLFCAVVGVADDDGKLFTMFSSSVMWPYVIQPLIFDDTIGHDSPEQTAEYIDYIINYFKQK